MFAIKSVHILNLIPNERYRSANGFFFEIADQLFDFFNYILDFFPMASLSFKIRSAFRLSPPLSRVWGPLFGEDVHIKGCRWRRRLRMWIEKCWEMFSEYKKRIIYWNATRIAVTTSVQRRSVFDVLRVNMLNEIVNIFWILYRKFMIIIL